MQLPGGGVVGKKNTLPLISWPFEISRVRQKKGEANKITNQLPMFAKSPDNKANHINIYNNFSKKYTGDLHWRHLNNRPYSNAIASYHQKSSVCLKCITKFT